MQDITAVLMGDPAARNIREPSPRERDRRPLREWTSIWSDLEVGDRERGLSHGRANDGRNWLRKRYREGVIHRLPNGTYDLVRTE